MKSTKNRMNKNIKLLRISMAKDDNGGKKSSGGRDVIFIQFIISLLFFVHIPMIYLFFT